MPNGSSLALAWRENVGATKNNAAHSLSIDLENQKLVRISPQSSRFGVNYSALINK